jgi:hypothetical protein
MPEISFPINEIAYATPAFGLFRESFDTSERAKRAVWPSTSKL